MPNKAFPFFLLQRPYTQRPYIWYCLMWSLQWVLLWWKYQTLLISYWKEDQTTSICDHLLHCNFLPSFDNFSVLAHENKRYLLKIKESLLIMRDKPSLNRNINSAPLYQSLLISFSLFHISLFSLVSLFLSNIIIKL